MRMTLSSRYRLTVVIRRSFIEITTVKRYLEDKVIRIYPVGDLVMPINGGVQGGGMQVGFQGGGQNRGGFGGQIQGGFGGQFQGGFGGMQMGGFGGQFQGGFGGMQMGGFGGMQMGGMQMGGANRGSFQGSFNG